jgi:type IV secretory pathway TrbL component
MMDFIAKLFLVLISFYLLSWVINKYNLNSWETWLVMLAGYVSLPIITVLYLIDFSKKTYIYIENKKFSHDQSIF